MDSALPEDLQHLLEQQEWLRRLSRRLLGAGPEAEDLAQETLARAIQARRPVTRNWLARVARNLSFEERRSEANRRARELASAQSKASGAEELDRASLRRRILGLVLELDEPERTAVVLRYLEDQGYGTIAARQGVSEPAARKRVSRGVERLRQRLDERPGGREAWAGLLAPLLMPTAAISTGALAPQSALVAGAVAMNTKYLLLALAVFLAVCLPFALRDDGAVQPGPHAGAVLEGPELVAAHDAEDATLGSQVSSSTRLTLAAESNAEDSGSDSAEPAFSILPSAQVGTLDVQVRWSDGTPAEGIRLTVTPWGSNDAFLMQRGAITGSGGVVAIQQLPPGRVALSLDRGGGQSVDVTAGVRKQVELTIPVGFTLTGRVLDPSGAPVPGATICLSDHGNPNKGRPVAVADAEGRYRVRDVSRQPSISARSAGFAPSDQLYAKGATGRVGELDLVLRGAGGTLSGVVLSPSGLPVSGAKIRVIGAVPAGWDEPRDGRWREVKPLPFQVRSDDLGRFEIDQIGGGAVQVMARAEAWLPWAGAAVVPPGGRAEVEIRLELGAVLEGTVLRADGSPAGGAIVSTGRYGSFDSYRVLCDGSGHYSVHGLPPGAVKVNASVRNVGKASAQVHLEEGVQNRWDVTLVEGGRLVGSVVDEAGQPLVGWRIGCIVRRGLWDLGTTTGADGRFVMTGITEEHSDVGVGPADLMQTGPCVVLKGVLPAQEELHIVVPDDTRPTGAVRARILLEGQPAPGDTRVYLRPRGQHGRELHPDGDGCIESERFIAGDYEAEVNLTGYPVLRAEFSIAPQQSVDLGDLSIERGGIARIELEGRLASTVRQAHVVDEKGSYMTYIDLEEGRGESEPLAAGPVRIRIAGSKVAMTLAEVTIVPGETSIVRSKLRPGTSRRLCVRRRDGAPIERGTSAVVTDGAGRVILSSSSFTNQIGPPEQKDLWVSGLEVGSYRVLIESPDGGGAEAVITVADLEPESGKGQELWIE